MLKLFRKIFPCSLPLEYSATFKHSSLVSLDASYSHEVTDFGIQNLIFPPTILSNRGGSNAGMKVNLTNTRARTSQVAKLLQVRNQTILKGEESASVKSVFR